MIMGDDTAELTFKPWIKRYPGTGDGGRARWCSHTPAGLRLPTARWAVHSPRVGPTRTSCSIRSAAIA